MAEAVQRMVVHEADGLHERVADRRPHEAEAAPPQVVAERARQRGFGRDRPRRPSLVLQRPPAHEAPQVLRERAVLGLHGQERLRIADGGRDLGPVAHDALVDEQPPHVGGVEAGDAPGVELGEGAPEGRTLAQDRRPRQPGLGALEQEELEEDPVVAHGHAPLAVVVLDVERLAGPAAAPRRGRARVVGRAARRTHGQGPSIRRPHRPGRS